MKLSLKVEYACRVLAQLGALQKSRKLVHIEELAKIEEVPKNYLVQILSELRAGGLINSRRGRQGGYSLVRPPDKITLYDVIQVVDSELLELNFGTQGKSGQKVAQVWRNISAELEKMTKHYTLKSFIPDNSEPMYHI